MSKTEILEKLIMEGEELTNTIYYVESPPNVIRFNSVYRSKEKENYQNWQSAVQRFIKTYFPSDLEEIKNATKAISPTNHQKIMGTIRAIKLLPEEPKKTDKNNTAGTNITINNTQQIVLNLFVDAIKDEITGKEYKNLKDILKNYEREPEKTEIKLKGKLKNLGGDVLSNIIANILTNPNIYGGLF